MIRLGLLLFFCVHLAFSQQAKVHMSDYHTSQITNIIPTAEKNGFITSDQSGKILFYDTDTYTYKSTIKKSDGFPIESMQLLGKEGALLYKSKDSLFYVNYNSSAPLGKTSFKGNVLQQSNPRYKIITNPVDFFSDLLVIIDLNENRNLQVKTKNKVISAIITPDNNHVIYVEEKRHPDDQNIVCVNLIDNSILWETPFISKNKILHIFKSYDNSIIEAVTFSEEDDLISIYKFTTGIASTKPAIEIPFSNTKSATKISDFYENHNFLMITSSTISLYPIVIKEEKGVYTFKRCEINNTYDSVFFNPKKNELIFPNNMINYVEGTAKFIVFDLNQFKIKKIYPHETNSYYEGAFLPNDNWMVFGKELVSPTHDIKYYNSGTFYNRFSKFNFNNYLQQNFKLLPLNRSISYFNFTTGKIAFFIANYNTGENTIYEYDLIKDQIDVLFDLKNNYLPEVLDYNEKAKLLLLSKEKYNEFGYTQPQEISFVKDKKISILDGLYKYAKISNDGNYILTINENNIAEIIDHNKKSVFKEELTNGKYTLFAVEDSGFIIANEFKQFTYDKCYKESILIEINSSKKYEAKKHECAYVTHVSYKNEKLALFIEGVGLMIDEKPMPIFFSKPPKAISLNSDASKIMISFSDGKIGVYDTTTFEELGAMYHPSANEHIMFSTKGYYFSNTDASNFLFATKASERISLEQADNDVFNPKEVLSVFGKPNEEYVTVLDKAIALRENKNNLEANYNQKQIKTPLKNNLNSNEKPNLYVLSIGVSDYEQNEYSLTFADKDALDIANLYGNLDVNAEEYYKKKFYGKKYKLKNITNKEFPLFLKFYDTYNTANFVGSLNKENTRWLEVDKNNNTFIWDFNKNEIMAIKMPELIKYEYYSSLDENQIYINPDNDNFYFRSKKNNTLYRYDSFLNIFNKLDISYNLKDNFSELNFQFLENNNLLYIEQNSNSSFKIIVYNISNFNKQEFIVSTNDYLNTENIIIKDAWLYYPKLKCASLDGSKCVFSTENKVFLLELNSNSNLLLQELPFEIDSSHKFYLKDNFLITYKYFDDSSNLKETKYDLDLKLKEEKIIQRNGVSISSTYNSNPTWIEEYNSLLESNDAYIENKKLSNYNPYSFNNIVVKHLINNEATAQNIKENLETFFATTNPQDEIIVFLAGHGVLDTKNNYYYAPHDMDFTNISKSGVSFDFIINALKKSPSKNKLLLMDSCHSGNTLDLASNNDSTTHQTINQGQRGSKSKSTNQKMSFKMSDVVSSVFDNFLSTSGVTVISASSGGDVAYENETLGNGAFTTAYLKVLDDKLGGFLRSEENTKQEVVLTEKIIAEIMKEVASLTNGKQIPDIREINKNVELKLW